MTRHSEKKKQPDPTNFSDHHSILAKPVRMEDLQKALEKVLTGGRQGA